MENGNRDNNTRDIVRKGYAGIATGGSCCGPSSCCGGSPADSFAETLGYSREELAGLPDGANMGLSCGNPTAIASIRPGETVLDLGSGGGFDVFIAAGKVGPKGLVIGVDMTAEMLETARRNAESFRDSTGLSNVEFRLGEIENIPFADSSVDLVISNCVINLSPDKPQVWREIARILRPGGRVSVSDIALLQPLPAKVAQSVEALVGCVAGAVLAEETRRFVESAGLVVETMNKRPDFVKSAVKWSDPLYVKIVENLPAGDRLSDYVTSLGITARKPD